MEGSSGSVVLQQTHTDFNEEMEQREKQMYIERLEMAKNNRKRTRHPFSGYTDLLYRERTQPVVKMKLRKPKPPRGAMSMEDRDTIMGGVDPNREPAEPPPPPPVLPADDLQLRGFQQPVWDPNLQKYKFTTLTSEGHEMIRKWEQDYGREYRNAPDKIFRFSTWLIDNIERVGVENQDMIYNYLLGIGNHPDIPEDDEDD